MQDNYYSGVICVQNDMKNYTLFLTTNSYVPLSFTFQTFILQMVTRLISDTPTHKKVWESS
jgi:hypothetical protein